MLEAGGRIGQNGSLQVRAEYNIDLATYGPHFLNHAVYRDEPDAPVVSGAEFLLWRFLTRVCFASMLVLLRQMHCVVL